MIIFILISIVFGSVREERSHFSNFNSARKLTFENPHDRSYGSDGHEYDPSVDSNADYFVRNKWRAFRRSTPQHQKLFIKTGPIQSTSKILSQINSSHDEEKKVQILRKINSERYHPFVPRNLTVWTPQETNEKLPEFTGELEKVNKMCSLNKPTPVRTPPELRFAERKDSESGTNPVKPKNELISSKNSAFTRSGPEKPLRRVSTTDKYEECEELAKLSNQ